jgi:hypothetical protein
VRFDERREPGVLELSGADAEALALALARHAVDGGVVLSEIRLGAPPLEALLAARAAVARRYYEASYASVMPQPMPSPNAPPSGAPAWAPYVPDTQTAPRPPDQSVSMPTDFGDPGAGKPGGDATCASDSVFRSERHAFHGARCGCSSRSGSCWCSAWAYSSA